MQQNLPSPASSQAPTLGSRLAECATKLGGKRALAKAAGLSEAQLFRYINGDCDIAVSKLQALATAAQVAPEWLLTGTPITAPPARPEFNPELLRQVTQTVEEYLYEYPITFSPKHRAELIALAYESLRHDMAAHNLPPDLSREAVFDMLDSVAALKKTNEITIFHNLMQKVEFNKHPLSHTEQLTLDRLVKLSKASLYNGISGKMYFDRTGITLSPNALQNLLKLVASVQPGSPREQPVWLDLGCGNGRYLLPLAHHAPHLKLHGVDISDLAEQEMQQHIRSGKLPADCFQKAQLSALPHKDATFDFVFCRMTLHSLPHVEAHDSGLSKVFTEIRRVLKPNGKARIITPHGIGQRWLPYFQYLTPTQIQSLAEGAGLKVVTSTITPTQDITPFTMIPGQDLPLSLGQSVNEVTLVRA